jgi:alpha/beta superfamily hydrolase
MEALETVPIILPTNMTLFCFDFAGCGMSEGEYISLGWYEREDLSLIIDYLRANRRVSAIGLWGRSMGAVTALLHGDRDPTIAGMILDSPFSNLKLLTVELAK